MAGHPQAHAQDSFESPTHWIVDIRVKGVRFASGVNVQVQLTMKSGLLTNLGYETKIDVKGLSDKTTVRSMATYAALMVGMLWPEISNRITQLVQKVRDDLTATN